MSRCSVSNDKYTLAFGIDHAVGPFIQIWDKSDDGDDPILDIDAMFGISIRNVKQNPKLEGLVEEIDQQIKYFKEKRGYYPNLDAWTVCRLNDALDLSKDNHKTIYEVWD